MPSTLVHLAIGGLVGAALLVEEFDGRALAVVLLATALPDLDSFVALAFAGTHRALLHNLVVPGLLAAGMALDTRVERWRTRPRRSRLRARLGDRGLRIAWVALAALVAGGVFPDLFTNGVNVFYPLHDAFYTVDGKLVLSNQRGIVQTFVDLTPEEPARTTDTVVYTTGVDPEPGPEPKNVERLFPVARGGWQLMLILTSAAVLAVRLWEHR